VGGNPHNRKLSSVVSKLADALGASSCNGYFVNKISGRHLVVWMPEIPNSEPKNYLVKDQGTVLICSKVIRANRTEVDAVSRIFDMNANAVICIYKDEPKKMRFRLIDALGNSWCHTGTITVLAKAISKFYTWSKGQVRISYAAAETKYWKHAEGTKLPESFINLNTEVANRIENSLGARYFGNFSTRCMKLFPSTRRNNNYLFSPRNVDKRRIGPDDCIIVSPPYYVDLKARVRKYSVDAPCQVALYQQFPNIHFMIHGHAEIIDQPYTRNYYPCGDLREVEEIAREFRKGFRAVNLKNHGFLLASKNICEMENLIRSTKFQVNSWLRDGE
jgi:hypothetical protein